MNQASMKEKNRYSLPAEHGGNPGSFSVPEGYFDSLTDRIMENIPLEEPEQKVRFLRMIRPQLALAAAILGFALISFTAVKLLTSGSASDGYYDLATLEDMGYYYDEATLMEMIPADEDSEVTDEDLWIDDAINYLADNDMSFYQLFDELDN